jgi:signal peptidase I
MSQVQEPKKAESGSTVVRILIYILPVLAILTGYGLIIVATHETYPFTIVTGTSMQPTIMPGTVAVIDRVPFDQLKTGDIIVFVPQIALEFTCNGAPSNSLTSETPVPCYIIHRIVSITTNAQGQRIVETKGDNNPNSLPGYDTNINSSMYVGQVILQFPLIGYATVTPYNEYLALLILIVLAAQLLLDRRSSRRERERLGEQPPPPEPASGGFPEPSAL